MKAVFPLLLGFALPCAALAHPLDGLAGQVQNAVETKDSAGLRSIVSVIRRIGSADAITAEQVVGAITGCSFDKSWITGSRGEIVFLHYTCTERRKVASGCLSGDLSLAVDTQDRSLYFVESRADRPECAPALMPSPPANPSQKNKAQ